VQLFFTDTALLNDVEGKGRRFTSEDCKVLGLADGMPFILDRDGSYDDHLNRFFRALPTLGAPSPNSWRAVAMDVVLWIRFLAARGKTIWNADNTDLSAFWIVRRLQPSGGIRVIAKSTWSRWVASLDKLYTWALQQGLIASVPFTYKSATRPVSDTGERAPYEKNQAHERGARRILVKYLSLEQYLFFRDVGLRGRLPDGTLDPEFRGRNGTRNATSAELLVTTGIWNGEGSYLLICELPDPGSTPDGSLSFYLPGAVTKGGVEREIWFPVRVLRLVQDYVQIERDVSLGRAFDASPGGEYDGIERPIFVLQPRGERAYRVLPKGVLTRFDTISRAHRSRIVEYGTPSRPAMIWLTEQGRPMRQHNWNRAFERATERCRRWEQWNTAIDVTPHTLRHTFAVNMLAELTRAYYGQFSPDQLRSDLILAEKDLTVNPLLRVQRLLGHKHIATTMIYLDYMEEAREVVETASAQWAARTAPE
jgi:site-specific recombinase XerD